MRHNRTSYTVNRIEGKWKFQIRVSFLGFISCSFSFVTVPTMCNYTTKINLWPGGQYSRHIRVAVAFALVRPFWKNKTIFLSVNVFSTKVLIEDTIFVSPTGDGPAIFYVVIRLASSHKDLAVCKAKKFPSFFSHFKTLNIGPTLGIETRGLPRSTVMRSIDWTSPTALRHGGWAPRKGFSFSWTNVKF